MKKFISLVSMTALALTLSTSAFAAQGTVDRSVNFRSAPSTDSSVYSLLKPGTTFEIIDDVNQYWVKAKVNGKVGYLSTNYISEKSSSGTSGATGTVSRSVNFRSGPSTDSKVYGLLKAGSKFQVLEKVNSYWLKISADGKVGYVSTDYVTTSGTPAPSNPSTSQPGAGTADRIIQQAKKLQGVTRYEFGVNKAPNVMDCSAFTKYVFGKEGVELRWGTRYQKDAGKAVSKSNLQKGDLVFFGTSSKDDINHVGIYMGNGQFIHNAPSTDGVTISSLTSGYWKDKYISARHVL
ncbi:NlpC/P60 family protein [Paenibacillus allorhizosphaerae]|uniref:Hydrolase Nlp/P60 n=1 Tax=Paenibacillus allorhizosphaerae TaxID=2849866 RepID=A0ABM8VB67_9BACL|nr:C40 family peptidase [Paenibacillus allorhizosphaerae]CAG7618597.1 hypothetical protein PAECIP111802_00533 [Paenibacillus allorhizosphaerae]